MSNALAVATVSAVLAARVRALLDAADLAEAEVVTGHPGADADPGVYLHCYQLLPNADLRNAHLPERGDNGAVRQRPRLPVDLHYLVSFVGDTATQQPERLAGLVMTDWHRAPLLSAAEITEMLQALDNGHPLTGSDLADQTEGIRLTPLALDLEELSRLWGMLGRDAHHLSVAYRVQTVALEADAVTGEPLPVTTAQLRVFPMARPRLTEVRSAGANQPVVAFGDVLVVRGESLRGATTILRLGDERIQVDATDTEIRHTIDPASGLRAGVTSVQVVHEVDLDDGGTREAAASNTLPVALAPTVTGAASVSDQQVDGQPAHEVRVPVSPAPAADQRVEVLLTGQGSQSRWPASVDGGDVVAVVQPPLASGTHRIRVTVDGATSLMTTDAQAQITGPDVVVP